MAIDEKMENELKDVALCYKALGIPFDSSSAEVEKTYASLTEKLRRDMVSADPAVRLKAKDDLELVGTLYDKIRNSVNYQRKLKERSHASGEQEGAQKSKAEAKESKLVFKICPSCNNSVITTIKVCPFCRKRIYSSKYEKIWVENFTATNMLITLSILSCLAAVILIAINFEEIRGFISTFTKE